VKDGYGIWIWVVGGGHGFGASIHPEHIARFKTGLLAVWLVILPCWSMILACWSNILEAAIK